MNLNLAHVHLLLNHIPVLGPLFGIGLLAWAIVRRNESFFRASLWTFVIVGLFTIPTYFTGEPAEHILKRMGLPGIDRHAIEEHQDAALFAFIALGVLALLSIFLLVRYRRAETTPRGWAIATLLVALWAASVLARTAWLGGEIHHPEVRSGATAGLAGGGESDDD